jgi:hypothetical protein
VFYEKVKPNHSKKHDQGVGTPFLGEADMIGHNGQRDCARKSDGRRKLPGKEVDHRD